MPRLVPVTSTVAALAGMAISRAETASSEARKRMGRRMGANSDEMTTQEG
jgi:hypothetical protein